MDAADKQHFFIACLAKFFLDSRVFALAAVQCVLRVEGVKHDDLVRLIIISDAVCQLDALANSSW